MLEHTLAFFSPGPPELLLILVLAFFLFGANKLPELARSTGEAVSEFEKGREELEEKLDSENSTEVNTTETESEQE